jgi:hypothetical protein
MIEVLPVSGIEALDVIVGTGIPVVDSYRVISANH